LFPVIGLAGQIISRWGEEDNETDEESDGGDIECRVESSALLASQNKDAIDEQTLVTYGTTGNKNISISQATTGTEMTIEGDSLTLRVSLVICTYVVAIIIPHLKTLIALAGSITGSMTSLLIPPLLAIRFVIGDFLTSAALDGVSVKKMSIFGVGRKLIESSKYLKLALFNVVLITIGVVYAVLGTASSIQDIIAVYTKGA